VTALARETFILNKSGNQSYSRLANWSQAARKWLSPQGDRKWLDSLLRASRVSFPSLQKAAPVDVVLTPLLDLALPLVGPIIKGRKSALEVAKNPVILPTAAPGDVVYEGLLLNLLRAFEVSKNFASCWQIIISQHG